MTRPRIIAAIPTLSVNRLDHITAIVRELEALDVEVIVVANGHQIDEALARVGVSRISPGRNLGFGAAINLVARSNDDWDWLLLVNDDVVLDPERFGASLGAHLGELRRPKVVYFDQIASKNIPQRRDVFRSLALIDGASKAWRRTLRLGVPLAHKGLQYRPFSVVAISREAWSANGGFDERFSFTYEDADFVRRAHAAEMEFVFAESSGVHHEHSATGRRHIDAVLPASVWSGYQYLHKWGTPAVEARLICAAALVVRLPFILFVRGSRLRHLLGDVRALSALARNVEPTLPEYSSV